jgi:tetratricopeptide (TPR) repeat protein
MLLGDGNYNGARSQFKAAARADPLHLPVWQAWAVMEGSLGNYDEARALFQRGVFAAPKNPDVVYLWQVSARRLSAPDPGLSWLAEIYPTLRRRSPRRVLKRSISVTGVSCTHACDACICQLARTSLHAITIL